MSPVIFNTPMNKTLQFGGFLAISAFLLAACSTQSTPPANAIKPVLVTEPTKHDTDDPAIWIHPTDPEQSLIVGTDKNIDGALYVYDLNGKIQQDKVVSGIQRPNNVDIAYGLVVGTDTVDIAVTGERHTHNMRIFSLPDMQPLDGGGIPVFVGETGVEYRDLMGVALYTRPADGVIFAIMGRKTGPKEGYLWQYRLSGTEGTVKAELVRKFGKYSGIKEIEAIAVDNELGYIYYSDEGVGVRKYHADPAMGNEELALFAQEGFADDHEGISIYKNGDGTGFILVSDQQANEFHVYPREGSNGNPHMHPLLKEVSVSTMESDGSDITSLPLGSAFPDGLFVAMSDDKTFHYYSPKAILDSLLLK